MLQRVYGQLDAEHVGRLINERVVGTHRGHDEGDGPAAEDKFGNENGSLG
jgi:hypothetical protein